MFLPEPYSIFGNDCSGLRSKTEGRFLSLRHGKKRRPSGRNDTSAMGLVGEVHWRGVSGMEWVSERASQRSYSVLAFSAGHCLLDTGASMHWRFGVWGESSMDFSSCVC